MPVRKTNKKSVGSRKRKGPVTKAAKRVKAAASNPRRTVRKAADNVHKSATRARDLGDTVVTAGELIKETAAFVDSVAQRAKTRTAPGRRRRKS